MFRLAVETGEGGAVSRVVFLALRGEEGRAECFWPVPLSIDEAAEPKLHAKANSAAPHQLPLPAAQHRKGMPRPAVRAGH